MTEGISPELKVCLLLHALPPFTWFHPSARRPAVCRSGPFWLTAVVHSSYCDSRQQAFDDLLDQVIFTKRLSSSKMNKLTDMAMALIEVCLSFFYGLHLPASLCLSSSPDWAAAKICLSPLCRRRLTSCLYSFPPPPYSYKHDSHLVTTLYAKHCSLPDSSPHKIFSLYCFDALSRACRSKVNKGVSAKLKEDAGTCARFLILVEGVLDGLMDNMIGNGGVDWPEGRVSRS